MIETQLAQIAASLPAVESGKIPGNLSLPLKMLAWCLPDEVTRPGGHHTITMQVGTIPQVMMFGMAWWQQCKRI